MRGRWPGQLSYKSLMRNELEVLTAGTGTGAAPRERDPDQAEAPNFPHTRHREFPLAARTSSSFLPPDTALLVRASSSFKPPRRRLCPQLANPFSGLCLVIAHEIRNRARDRGPLFLWLWLRHLGA